MKVGATCGRTPQPDMRRDPGPLRIALLLLVVCGLSAIPAQAQGTLRGCAKDTHGGVLPGVTVIASNDSVRQKAVTDGSGRYELEDLPPGKYTVTAALAGFVTGRREDVAIDDRGATTIDFRMCLAALAEIDWVTPGNLANAVKAADAVLRIRVTATGPAKSSECPTNDFEHQAQVVEILKNYAERPISENVTFVQENWAGERTPYSIGQEMIVFLSEWEGVFVRLAGPWYVFGLDGDSVTTRYRGNETRGMNREQLLDMLRGLTKGAAGK